MEAITPGRFGRICLLTDGWKAAEPLENALPPFRSYSFGLYAALRPFDSHSSLNSSI